MPDQPVDDARQPAHEPAPLEYRQMWVGEHQTEQLAPLCTQAAQDGWSLHSVTFGKNSWLPPGNGPERLEGGWLVLFFRHRHETYLAMTHKKGFQVNTVYKYDLPAIGSTEDTFPVVMPAGARPLTVQLQYGEPKLWALVNPANDPVEYTLRVAGTGHSLARSSGHAYLGTVQIDNGRFVFHYFSVDD